MININKENYLDICDIVKICACIMRQKACYMYTLHTYTQNVSFACNRQELSHVKTARNSFFTGRSEGETRSITAVSTKKKKRIFPDRPPPPPFANTRVGYL